MWWALTEKLTQNSNLSQQRAGALIVFIALIVGIWQPGARPGLGEAIEGRLLDLRFLMRGPSLSPQDVAIVSYTDADASALGEYPPARSTLAKVVAGIHNSGARAVALDLLLVDERAGDTDLAASLSKLPSVLAVAEAPAESNLTSLENSGFSIVIVDDLSNPLPALAPTSLLANSATALGHVTLKQDSDGALRRLPAGLPLAVDWGAVWVPNLALVAVSAREESSRSSLALNLRLGSLTVENTSIELDRNGALPIDWYGPAGTIRTYSFGDLLAGQVNLSEKIVFLGASATGFGDRHVTPFDASLPGVEAHATLAANILTGHTLRRDSIAWSADIALSVLLAIVAFAAATQERPWVALGTAVATSLITGIVLTVALTMGWWLDATSALTVFVLATASGIGLRLIDHRRRAANLARYQSPRLVEELARAKRPAFDGRSQEAAVIFVDVADFTAYSEALGPADTASFLRHFHSHVERAAEKTDGVIEQFAGDGAMVLFGLPEFGPQDAAAALRFVLALSDAITEDPKWPDLILRFGGHAGTVQAGVLGGERHYHVSVSGDIVNTASRLVEVAKSKGRSIALSDKLVAASQEAHASAISLGLRPQLEETIRGRSARIDIWLD